jgi:hypothetical protein
MYSCIAKVFVMRGNILTASYVHHVMLCTYVRYMSATMSIEEQMPIETQDTLC